jgi:hypothetical protein
MAMITRLLTIAATVGASSVVMMSPAGAAQVGCDADPSSGDIQTVIDASPPGTNIQLARGCTYAVTATIQLKDGDALLGATSSTAPETFLVGSGQTIDCIGSTEPGTTDEATGVRLRTLDVSGCADGIDLNHEWEVGGSGASSVWSHDNNVGLNLGTVANPARDVKVDNARLFGNDLLGLKGAMSDTGVSPVATIAFSEIFANGDGGAECTATKNCAGSKLFGGYAAGPGGASPLVCGNVVHDNTGPRGEGQGLWVDVTGDNVGAFNQGLLFAGNTVRDNAGQGFRIERSDSHRVGAPGTVNCLGTTIDASNVIDDNGTPGGSCVAVIVSEYTRVTDNECNVHDDASARAGRLIQVSWKSRADLDEDRDGDIECTAIDADDCQKTTHNIVENNTVRLRASTDPAATSVGFSVTQTPFNGDWSANDYVANDYCVVSDRATEVAADHFLWVDSTGSGLDPQPWRLNGPGNDWRDKPDPRYDDERGASFSLKCQKKN